MIYSEGGGKVKLHVLGNQEFTDILVVAVFTLELKRESKYSLISPSDTRRHSTETTNRAVPELFRRKVRENGRKAGDQGMYLTTA